MPVPHRIAMVAILVIIFFIQTYMVYSDREGRRAGPLTPLAERGRQVWHENNCQSCHQIYGFGGFLGPDLTNMSRELTPARLETILTIGRGQMPALHLPQEDIDAISAYLIELDKTGVGTPRAWTFASPSDVPALDSPEWQISESAARGRDHFLDKRCLDCHLPNPNSMFQSTDITTIAGKLDRDLIRSTLADGRPEKGMPDFKFTADEIEDVIAYLEWLGENPDSVYAMYNLQPAGGMKVPWFEYPR